jgi:hypothetical protein
MRRRLILSENERATLNRGIKSPHETSDNLIVIIQRPSGHSLDSDIVAAGKYDPDGEKWIFECEEDALRQWLDATFSQPFNSRQGKIPVNSLDFLDQIKNTVMTRKGLVLTVK